MSCSSNDVQSNLAFCKLFKLLSMTRLQQSYRRRKKNSSDSLIRSQKGSKQTKIISTTKAVYPNLKQLKGIAVIHIEN